MRLLAATLDRETAPAVGEDLPCLWHWLYFLPSVKTSELGGDGHTARGEFVPPVALPVRMWAGSTVEFLMPIKVGESITRRASIADVYEKTGRSGRLIFVRIVHEVACPRGLAVVEEREIVFRHVRPTGASKPKAAPGNPQWRKRVLPDATLLFRYSALTFNSHRIHYDQRYAVDTEGFRNLVVPGPLIATLLAELAATKFPNCALRRLSFRSTHPLFVDEPFEIAGRADDTSLALWAAGPDKELSMTAKAELASWP